MYVNTKFDPGETVYVYNPGDESVTRCKVVAVGITINDGEKNITYTVMMGGHLSVVTESRVYGSGWSAFDANPRQPEAMPA